MTPQSSALSVADRADPPVNFGLLNRFDALCFILLIIQYTAKLSSKKSEKRKFFFVPRDRDLTMSVKTARILCVKAPYSLVAASNVPGWGIGRVWTEISPVVAGVRGLVRPTTMVSPEIPGIPGKVNRAAI
jgi:hypothetical protein